MLNFFVYALLLSCYYTSIFFLGVFHSLIETGFVLLVGLGADALIPDFNYTEEQPWICIDKPNNYEVQHF